MLLTRRPSAERIRAFIAAQAALPFSYAEIGASREAAPAGYACDHNRVRLGTGKAAFEAGKAALRAWRMFAIPGIELCWPSAPIAVGSTVAILAGSGFVWSLNACRIVYVLDEEGPPARAGFAYGTLPEHAVRGEERFLIEWVRETDEVYYDLLAFSRPSSLALSIARPLLRVTQRRFARLSLAAMREATMV